MKPAVWTLLLALCGCTPLAASVAQAGKPAEPAQPVDQRSAAARATLGAGYLNRQSLPDPLAYLPPPPAAGSAALARDDAAQRAAIDQQGSPRWDQARRDAELIDPAATALFSCAAGLAISEQTTPAIQKLLRKSTADFGMAGSAAKRRYNRPRPFMVNGAPSCTPEWEDRLRQDGSYPSGHSAVGYGWAMLLAELFPDRTAVLLARGRAYGDSRRVCNVHWLSDVEEGRTTAVAALTRMRAEPAFRADLERARAEAQAALATNPAKPDCQLENAALGTSN